MIGHKSISVLLVFNHHRTTFLMREQAKFNQLHHLYRLRGGHRVFSLGLQRITHRSVIGGIVTGQRGYRLFGHHPILM